MCDACTEPPKTISELFSPANLHATHAEVHLDLLTLLLADFHLAGVQCPQRNQAFACHLDHARASDPPHVHAHTAQRRAREAQKPLDIVWRPALRDPEDCLLREPELDDEACARGAKPSEGRDDAIEVGAEGLEGLRWGIASADVPAFQQHATHALTILLILGLFLVVLATQLGPLCEVILRRSVGHLPVQPNDFLAQGDTSTSLLGLWRRKLCVEEP